MSSRKFPSPALHALHNSPRMQFEQALLVGQHLWSWSIWGFSVSNDTRHIAQHPPCADINASKDSTVSPLRFS